MKRIKTIAGSFALLALTSVAGFIDCGMAHADEASFLNNIAAHGMPAGQDALTVGHGICTDASAHGAAGIANEVKTGLSVGFSHNDVAVMIVEAVYELCPSNMPALHAFENGSVTVS